MKKQDEVSDDIVNDVRKNRHKLEEPFKGNIKKFLSFIRTAQEKDKERLVKFKPKMRKELRTGTEG